MNESTIFLDPCLNPFDIYPRKAKCRNNFTQFYKDKHEKKEQKKQFKQISTILKKAEEERSSEEKLILESSADIVKLVKKRAQLSVKKKERVQEIEDDDASLFRKCQELAGYIKTSKNIVVYTGAGISTAASIPDYRGPNGVWTLLQQGKELEAQDLSDAEPTLTHMSLAKLYTEGYVKYVVSQNCDGLHLRSGLPRSTLSEIHGNMYLEVCPSCKPQREYLRLFDVTERTKYRNHATGRKCHKCRTVLRDTVVHFGEKGGTHSPYFWQPAFKAAENADLIICLGSSLKILKRYSSLWCMDKRVKLRPKLVVVNLQWTPKDESAALKINGRCDAVMLQVMHHLGLDVEAYQRNLDPIFQLAVPLRGFESKTTCKKILQIPSNYQTKGRVTRKLKDKFNTLCRTAEQEVNNDIPQLTQGTQLPSFVGMISGMEVAPLSYSIQPENSVIFVRDSPSLDLTQSNLIEIILPLPNMPIDPSDEGGRLEESKSCSSETDGSTGNLTVLSATLVSPCEQNPAQALCSGSPNGGAQSEKSSASENKRKSSTPSVPGWFGRGLAIKYKKKKRL